MKMFAVNIIEYVKFTEGLQEDFPIWSNIILAPANSREEARQRALEFSAMIQKEMTCDDRPAELVTAGIRQIWDIPDASFVSLSTNDCIEIAAFQMQVVTKEQLEALVNGDEVTVILDDLE